MYARSPVDELNRLAVDAPHRRAGGDVGLGVVDVLGRAGRDVVQHQVIVADLHVGDAVGARACATAEASRTRASCPSGDHAGVPCTSDFAEIVCTFLLGDVDDVRVGARLAEQRRRRGGVGERLSVGRPGSARPSRCSCRAGSRSRSSTRRPRPNRATGASRLRTPADRRVARALLRRLWAACRPRGTRFARPSLDHAKPVIASFDVVS